MAVEAIIFTAEAVLIVVFSLIVRSRAGKAPWERDGTSCNSESTKSMKGCGCTASLRVTMHPRYAVFMKEVESSSPLVEGSQVSSLFVFNLLTSSGSL